MRRCLNAMRDKPNQERKMSASWLLSDLCEAQYVDWTWHPVLKLLMIFPLWGVALPLTLQMAFFRSERPLRMNHNIRHQRRLS